MTVPSLRRCLRETSVRNARRRASELGALAADGGAAQVAGERGLLDLGVLLALVLLLDPGLGGDVEQIERELGLALEHGQEAPFDLSPERLLLSVLLGRIGQRRVVDDAEALEALGGLGGEHGGAVVGEKRAGQAALVEGLREAVDERLGGLVEVPLQVAAEARAVVEDAEELGLLAIAPAVREDGARALVEVQVPEAVDVRDLVGARLAGRERLVALATPASCGRARGPAPS